MTQSIFELRQTRLQHGETLAPLWREILLLPSGELEEIILDREKDMGFKQMFQLYICILLNFNLYYNIKLFEYHFRHLIRTLNGLPRFLIYTSLSFQLLIDLLLRVNLRQFMSQLQVKLSLLHNPIVDRLSQSQGHHRGLTVINWMLVLHTVDTSMLVWGLVN